MSTIKALASGIVGAVSLTVLHQILKATVKDAPRVDNLGEKAIKKSLDKAGIGKPSENILYAASLAGDLIFNSIYYSFTAAGKMPLLSGSLLGLAAGVGTVSLPEKMGLGNKYSAKNLKTKVLSFGIYLTGGLAAAATYKLLGGEKEEE